MVAFVSSLPTFIRRLPELAFVFSTQKDALWFGPAAIETAFYVKTGGQVMSLGDNIRSNGIMLSPDDSSFLDYFWSWRALLGGLYSVLLADLPEASVYHAVSTGYAGLFAARAALETGRPVLLTEHGIYTNERRIEIGMADWLHGQQSGFQVDRQGATLKDLWIDTFIGYSETRTHDPVTWKPITPKNFRTLAYWMSAPI